MKRKSTASSGGNGKGRRKRCFSWCDCPHPDLLAADFQIFDELSLKSLTDGNVSESVDTSSSSSTSTSTSTSRKECKSKAKDGSNNDVAEPLFSSANIKKLVRKPKPFRALDATGNHYRASRGEKGSLTARPAVLPPSEWPSCTCQPSAAGCGQDCINRQLFMECRLGACRGRLGNALDCGNTSCQTRNFPKTKVVLTEGCGWGLKLLEPVARGTPIIEYCGEVITVDTCRTRLANLVSSALCSILPSFFQGSV
jgi:hypothetical protein